MNLCNLSNLSTNFNKENFWSSDSQVLAINRKTNDSTELIGLKNEALITFVSNMDSKFSKILELREDFGILKEKILCQVQDNCKRIRQVHAKISSMDGKIDANNADIAKVKGKFDIHADKLEEIHKQLEELKKSPNYSNNSPTVNRNLVKGTGFDIGIKVNYHLALGRIPVNYDINTLKDKIQVLYGENGAKLTNISNLEPKIPRTGSGNVNKTVKLTVEYAGKVDDIYNPNYYPQGATLRRYRFPRATNDRFSGYNNQNRYSRVTTPTLANNNTMNGKNSSGSIHNGGH